jgi:hypothetical protein
MLTFTFNPNKFFLFVYNYDNQLSNNFNFKSEEKHCTLTNWMKLQKNGLDDNTIYFIAPSHNSHPLILV